MKNAKKTFILNVKNNGVSLIIGKKGNFKIDLQNNNYFLSFNKIENCWELMSCQNKESLFWLLVDKKIELVGENIFKVNSKLFRIIHK